MSDSAFLEEIVANPEDDLPRLVYADWLEEQGNPRAEFIRLQCERAELQEQGIKVSRQREIKKREKELLAVYEGEWFSGFEEKLRKTEWRRGFVEVATLGLRTFVNHAKPIYAETPLQQITLTAGSNLLPKLAKCESLQHVRHLSFKSNSFPRGEIGVLGSSEFLTKLHTLHLTGNSNPGEEGIRALAEDGSLSNLRVLELSGIRLRNCDISPLFATDTFPHLEVLQLPYCGVDGTKVPALLASTKNFAKLRVLNLAFNGSGYLRAILENPKFYDLEELDLSGCDITNNSLEQLFSADSPLSKLTILKIGNGTGFDGLEAIASSPLLGQLQFLDLQYSGLRLQDIRLITNSPHWSKSKNKLNLNGNLLNMRETSQLQKEFGKTFGNLHNHYGGYY